MWQSSQGPSCGIRRTGHGLAQAQDRTFFVTSVGKGNGADLGDIEGADAHCNARAIA